MKLNTIDDLDLRKIGAGDSYTENLVKEKLGIENVRKLREELDKEISVGTTRFIILNAQIEFAKEIFSISAKEIEAKK